MPPQGTLSNIKQIEQDVEESPDCKLGPSR